MKNATLLVLAGPTLDPTELEPLTRTAHERNLRLSILVLGDLPRLPPFTYAVGGFGAMTAPEFWQEEADAARTACSEAGERVEHYLKRQGITADLTVLCADPASVTETVARRALVCDMVVLSDDLRGDVAHFDNAVWAALFRTPAGVFVNVLKNPAALWPERVFVAWKAGLPAARAVRAALPLLREAREVTLGLFDPVATAFRDGENPGSDVAAWLTQHGCTVTVQQYTSGGEEIGLALCRRAREDEAQLVVMGAYDRSRMRETLFGGTTRTLLEQPDLPLLIAH